MPCSCRKHVNCITPPHLLKKLLESDNPDLRGTALNSLLTTAHLQGERSVRALSAVAAAPDTGRRTIYDCRGAMTLPSAKLARTEDGAPTSDNSVNAAFDGLGHTFRFFKEVFGRNSIDDRGMRLNGFVHYGSRYQNAFWDGQEMVFGDGDGVVFGDFTLSLDVIAHELAHGVTEYTAGFEYHKQSGALNESVSDVFGSLVKQWTLGQSAGQADWLIGQEVFTPGIGADALRSMKAPGTAYDSPTLGKDPQPDHMDGYADLPDTRAGDWGGVHINSGIPNRAFYLAATAIGGFAWEAPGHIWYESLRASSTTSQFQDFADTTYAKAGQLYGTKSGEQQAILHAWREVGIRISGAHASSMPRTRSGSVGEEDGLAALRAQLEALATQVNSLSREVVMLQEKH
ncbi:MAG TPA: M4 family metallopeptidase [Longimicrobium sp.]|jgi:Zn-dependent metalloprotease